MLEMQSRINIERDPNSSPLSELAITGRERQLRGSERRLLGSWRLEDSFEQDIHTGEAIRARGLAPKGYLTYTENRMISVQVMNDGGPPLDLIDPDACCGSLAKAAFFGYTAYYGWFEVDEEERSAIHHMDGSLVPNEVGSSRKRFFNLTGDRLTLVTPPFGAEGCRRVRWIVWVRDGSF
jgi:hypothetical protein